AFRRRKEALDPLRTRAAAGDRSEGARGPRAVEVERPGDALLARPGLAVDQHRRGGTAQAVDLGGEAKDRRRTTGEAGNAVGGARRDGGCGQRPTAQRLEAKADAVGNLQRLYVDEERRTARRTLEF